VHLAGGKSMRPSIVENPHKNGKIEKMEKSIAFLRNYLNIIFGSAVSERRLHAVEG
jgi:hypothetical protein